MQGALFSACTKAAALNGPTKNPCPGLQLLGGKSSAGAQQPAGGGKPKNSLVKIKKA